jgi:hypothetical protein
MSNFDFTGKPGLQAFIEGQIARAVEAERAKYVRRRTPLRRNEEMLVFASMVLGAIAGAALVLAAQLLNHIF